MGTLSVRCSPERRRSRQTYSCPDRDWLSLQAAVNGDGNHHRTDACGEGDLMGTGTGIWFELKIEEIDHPTGLKENVWAAVHSMANVMDRRLTPESSPSFRWIHDHLFLIDWKVVSRTTRDFLFLDTASCQHITVGHIDRARKIFVCMCICVPRDVVRPWQGTVKLVCVIPKK